MCNNMDFWIALIGCNGFWAVVTVLIQTGKTRGAMKSLMKAVSYYLLSENIEKLLDQDYATPEERQTLTHLISAYKANGWNGDMNARLQKVYALPTKKLEK